MLQVLLSIAVVFSAARCHRVPQTRSQVLLAFAKNGAGEIFNFERTEVDGSVGGGGGAVTTFRGYSVTFERLIT